LSRENAREVVAVGESARLRDVLDARRCDNKKAGSFTDPPVQEVGLRSLTDLPMKDAGEMRGAHSGEACHGWVAPISTRLSLDGFQEAGERAVQRRGDIQM